MPQNNTQHVRKLQDMDYDEIVSKVIQAYLPLFHEHVETHAQIDIESGSSQSPIELLLSIGLEAQGLCYDRLLVRQQVTCGPYTVDFVVSFEGITENRFSVCVECDGHDFHEKTRKQAAHDKKRDRFISGHYGRVLRFTGSEVWSGVDDCCDEIRGVAHELWCNSHGYSNGFPSK